MALFPTLSRTPGLITGFPTFPYHLGGGTNADRELLFYSRWKSSQFAETFTVTAALGAGFGAAAADGDGGPATASTAAG